MFLFLLSGRVTEKNLLLTASIYCAVTESKDQEHQLWEAIYPVMKVSGIQIDCGGGTMRE